MTMISCSGLMVSIISLYILTFILGRPASASRVKILLSLSPGVAGVCVHYTAITPGLSIIVQMLTWIIFICSTPLALATRPFYLERTPALCLALLSSYNLLSLSYEVKPSLFSSRRRQHSILFLTYTISHLSNKEPTSSFYSLNL